MPNTKAIVLLSLGLSVASHAEITLDGSIGRAGTVNLDTHNTYLLDSRLGKLAGGNLFYSFGKFNLETGTTAHFTDSSHSAVSNIISRVTGGQASMIDGTIQSSIPNANVYLINPAGVVFGANARLDVPGAFAASTADYLLFQDGNRVAMTVGTGELLTIATPAAFGFLDHRIGEINIDGASLQQNRNQGLQLIGGEMQITGSTLSSAGGTIALVSLAAANEVRIDTLSLNPSGNRGDISIRNSLIKSNGDGGGRFTIKANNLSFQDSELFANNTGDNDATGISVIDVQNTLNLESAYLATQTWGAGRGGDFSVFAKNIHVLGGSEIDGSVLAEGRGGDVGIIADRITLDGQSTGIGNGIFVEAEPGSRGDAGNLTIAVKELQVLGGSEIDASTYAEGHGGAIDIQADTLILDGQGLGLSNGVFVRAKADSTNDAGNLTVNVQHDLHILGGSKISGSTFGEGRGGNVDISAGNLRLNAQGFGITNGIFAEAEPGSRGDAGVLNVQARHDLQVLGGSEIDGSTYAFGKGGTVNVVAGNMVLDGQGLGFANGIFTRANPGSAGKAGDLSVMAQHDLHIVGGSKISGSTFSIGRGGDVTVIAKNIAINSAGVLSNGIFAEAEAESRGDAGDLLIQAADMLHIQHGEGISGATHGSGKGGNIAIAAKHLRLDQRGEINALSTTQADAGAIRINSPDQPGSTVELLGNSKISVSSQYGNAGDMNAYANRWVYLLDSAMTTCSGCGFAQSHGSGGNIHLDASFALLNNGQLITTAEYGRGGNIIIASDFLFQSVDSMIDPSSAFGVSGIVSIQSQYANIAGSIAMLPNRLLDTSNLLQAECSQVAIRGSSFVVGGRGGLPLTADGLFASALLRSPCHAGK